VKRRLFLTGPIGCGKSTLIKNALGPAAVRAGGFVTVRIRARSGALEGFDLLPACSLACPGRYFEAHRFLSFGPDGTRRCDSVFNKEAARLLREAAEEKSFAVLDELGGFELLLPEFSAALDAFLAAGIPCLGVLKALPAADELQARIGLTGEYLRAARQLRERLDLDADTWVLETSGRYDAGAEAALGRWVERYVGNI
jgi:nucleoside-triphosphatase THEP1